MCIYVKQTYWGEKEILHKILSQEHNSKCLRHKGKMTMAGKKKDEEPCKKKITKIRS